MGGIGEQLGLGALVLWPAICAFEAAAAFPSLQRSHGDAGFGACAPQPGPAAMCFVCRARDTLVIFQGIQSSPRSWKRCASTQLPPVS